MDQETKSCTATHFPCVGSPYQRNAVPIHLFYQDPRNPASKVCKTCYHCRQYAKLEHENYRGKLESMTDGNSSSLEFAVCVSRHHKSPNTSYPKEKVPIVEFYKERHNPTGIIYKTCNACRSKDAARGKELMAINKAKGEQEGKFYCTKCHRYVDPSERAINYNGTPSITCLPCKDGERARGKAKRAGYRAIKSELIPIMQSCCCKCQCLFFKPGTICTGVGRVPTFEIDGFRYFTVTETGMSYKVLDALPNIMPNLEVNVLELDHLTEYEQRERGILKPEDPYISKVKKVCSLSSEYAMRLEAKKCQMLCARCHLIETMRRHGMTDPLKGKKKKHQEKILYTWQVKESGCVLCGYAEPNLPRFFHFDHIDPSIKTECISNMLPAAATLEEMKLEIAKCRVLCLFCHQLHSHSQHAQRD